MRDVSEGDGHIPGRDRSLREVGVRVRVRVGVRVRVRVGVRVRVRVRNRARVRNRVKG